MREADGLETRKRRCPTSPKLEGKIRLKANVILSGTLRERDLRQGNRPRVWDSTAGRGKEPVLWRETDRIKQSFLPRPRRPVPSAERVGCLWEHSGGADQLISE